LEAAVESAVEKSTGKMNTNQAVSRMHDKLSFTNDEVIEPVAKAMLAGFIRQGQRVDEAIASVGKSYEAQTRSLMKQMGMKPPQGDNFQFGADGVDNTNGQEASYEGYGDHSKSPDWFNVLAG